MDRVLLYCVALLTAFLLASGEAVATPTSAKARASRVTADDSSRSAWKTLIDQAASLGLPTRFLKAIPSDFVRFEFEDLHAYAAEYHPGEHRMVLNRALSFNGAGATLQSLRRMTHKEIETLFHELFHAYIDFLVSDPAGPADMLDGRALLKVAQTYQQCRYQDVLITPIVQRKTETEQRYLSEQESWEAMNESWAVFVGWTVWTHLETRGKGRSGKNNDDSLRVWLERLAKSDRDGDLRGYYQPEVPEERTVARKRFLASASRIAPEEIGVLMDKALGFPAEAVRRSVEVVAQNPMPIRSMGQCTGSP